MFCKYCGKEVDEQAYVCTGCGCLIERTPQKKQENKKPTGQEDLETVSQKSKIQLWLKILIIIAFSCIGVALIFDFSAIADAHIYVSSYSSSVYFYPGYSSFAIYGFIYGILSLCAGTTAFILALIKEKEFTKLKLLSIISFIMATAVFVVGVVYVAT